MPERPKRSRSWAESLAARLRRPEQDPLGAEITVQAWHAWLQKEVPELGLRAGPLPDHAQDRLWLAVGSQKCLLQLVYSPGAQGDRWVLNISWHEVPLTSQEHLRVCLDTVREAAAHEERLELKREKLRGLRGTMIEGVVKRVAEEHGWQVKSVEKQKTRVAVVVRYPDRELLLKFSYTTQAEVIERWLTMAPELPRCDLFLLQPAARQEETSPA